MCASASTITHGSSIVYTLEDPERVHRNHANGIGLVRECESRRLGCELSLREPRFASLSYWDQLWMEYAA